MRFLRSPYTTNRGDWTPDTVVIHCTDWAGGMPPEYFVSNERHVSAHYCIFKDGSIVQYVDEATGANQAGNIVNPTSALVQSRGQTNPNKYTIGIEHDLKAPDPMTDAQKVASYNLVRAICGRWAIPQDRTHVIGHREITSLKTCPGWGVNMDTYVNELNNSQNGSGEGDTAETANGNGKTILYIVGAGLVALLFLRR